MPTGPDGTNATLTNAPLVGTQGLTNFALNRADPTLGFGGLVLSASSESVNVLLRALKQNKRVEVLSRPQVMTMDNQEAMVQVGQQVGILTGSTSTTVGQTNTVNQANIGLILLVTPRVSDEGVVVMQVAAQNSNLDRKPGHSNYRRKRPTCPPTANQYNPGDHHGQRHGRPNHCPGRANHKEQIGHPPQGAVGGRYPRIGTFVPL